MMDGHHRGPSPPSPPPSRLNIISTHATIANRRWRLAISELRRNISDALSFCPSVLAYSHFDIAVRFQIIHLHPSPRHIVQTGASEFASIFWRQEYLFDCHTHVLDIQVKISK
jgi:hypothetical protein